MTPTNNTLFRLEETSESASEPPADLGCGAGAGLVVRWSWLHGTRSLFPLVGAVVDSRGIPSRSQRAVESDQHGSIRNQLCPKALALCVGLKKDPLLLSRADLSASISDGWRGDVSECYAPSL
jgi:hypothetical protein